MKRLSRAHPSVRVGPHRRPHAALGLLPEAAHAEKRELASRPRRLQRAPLGAEDLALEFLVGHAHGGAIDTIREQHRRSVCRLSPAVNAH